MADIEYLTVDHLSTKDLVRIFSKISIDPSVSWNGTPCWIWTGTRASKGYGRTHWINKNYITHRLIWAWLIAPLPKGQKHGELDHLCRRSSCCNPLHQEFVPTNINVLRSTAPSALNAKKTHCVRGHQFTSDNTYTSRKGGRFCKQCRSFRNQRLWHTQTAEHRLAHNQRIAQWRAIHREHVNAQARGYRSGSSDEHRESPAQS